jgi:Holliday junction resolvase RusA-like endonuclease
LLKFVLDSLNTHAFNDDRQISVLNSAKLYTDNEPKICVSIRKLDDDKFNEPEKVFAAYLKH